MNENEDSYLIDTGVEIKDTNFGYTLSLIGGKWKMENGKWKMENGKWKMENDDFILVIYVPTSDPF